MELFNQPPNNQCVTSIVLRALTRSVSEGCRKSVAARRQRPRSRFGLVRMDRAARQEEALPVRSGGPAQPVKPKEGIPLLGSIERLEEFRVRISPDPLDGESFGVGDIVWPLAGICASHHQKLDLLGLEVG